MTDIVGELKNLNFLVFKITHFSAAYFKSELTRISSFVGTVPQIEKLTGDNSKLEKERVMQSFKER